MRQVPSRFSQRVRAAISPASACCVSRQVVEPEHHQRVAIGKDALVDRLPETGLVHALENCHGMAGDFLSDALEAERGNVEQLERPSDTLEKIVG